MTTLFVEQPRLYQVCKIYSTKLHSQTIIARELKLWNNVHLPPCVLCHMTSVTCHISHAMCQMSHFKCNNFFSYFLFLWTKWWSRSVEVLLSMEPTPSRSFLKTGSPASFFAPDNGTYLKYWYIFFFLCDRWHMKRGRWHVTGDRWQVTCDR